MTRIEGILHFDGGCSPNPGPSRCGFVLSVGNTRVEKSIDLGAGTNNTAEYHGLIHGLKEALRRGVTQLEAYGDSRLVLDGVRKMKPYLKGKPHLEVLKAEAQSLVRQFPHGVELIWVGRDQNSEADALTRVACGGA